MLPLPLVIFLAACFNILWIVVYGIAIRRGLKDKTYPVPVIALAANTAWDVYGTVIYPGPMGQVFFNAAFLIADAVFLVLIIRFWQSDSKNMSRNQFYFFVVMTMFLGIVLYLATTAELNDIVSVKMAFIDNFINSAAFLGMFFRRPDLKGQSFYIALLKMIGTGCASIVFTFNRWPGTETSVLLPILAVSIAFLDILYTTLVYQRSKALGLNPLKRF